MAQTKWVVDPAHSEFKFKVRHLMITNVTGYFKQFNIEVETEDEDFKKASKILVTADIDSIDTNNDQRDTHLKSPDFFAADQYKQLKFEGKHFEKASEGYDLTGILTIRDVSKEVSVNVIHTGVVQDAYGQTKAGFTVTGKINRKEFNLTWDAVTEAGQVVAGNEIRIDCEIQLTKQ